MDSFGEQLKYERESRDVALDEIARSTKIRVRYLEALEQGQHERLPGIVFAKGYVRAYCETIGADADRLVAAYVAEQRSLGRLETEASQERVLAALAAAVPDRPDPATRRIRSVFVGSIGLVAVVALAWFGVRPWMNRGDGTSGRPAPQAATMLPMPAPIENDRTEPVQDAAATVQRAVTTGDAAIATQDETERNEASAIESNETHTASIDVEPVADVPGTVPSPTTLSIPDHGVGTGVQQRALVGESSSFETGTQVVFWTRVLGGEPGRSVRHVWSHEGNVTGTVELSIGAAHWRTYSRQTLRQSGEWTVEAQDEHGNVLARRTFLASPA